MKVYPEIESWNEFYPSEIFILMGANESIDDAFPMFKIANIGTTFYLGISSNETLVYKKIGDIEAASDVGSSIITVGYVKNGLFGG